MESVKFSNGKLIVGESEYVFNELIPHFSKSKYIGIMTYNISGKSGPKNLLDELQKACNNGTEVTLVTNIPKRFNYYYSDPYNRYAKSAKYAIDYYLDTLEPKKIGPSFSVYFNFHNHAKIIVTDEIAYWGSSNYSDESKSNIECGTISRDPKLIRYLKDEFFPEVCEHSVAYYKYDLVHAIWYVREARDLCESYGTEIKEAAYIPLPTHSQDELIKWVYDSSHSDLTSKMLQRFSHAFDKFEDALEVIPKILNSSDSIDYEIQSLRTIYDRYIKIYSQLQDSIEYFSSEVCEMSNYEEDVEACQILSDKFGMEAFDENLEEFMEQAMEESHDEYTGLVESAEPVIEEILEQLEAMAQCFDEIEKELDSLCYADPEIDNTNVD